MAADRHEWRVFKTGTAGTGVSHPDRVLRTARATQRQNTPITLVILAHEMSNPRGLFKPNEVVFH